MAGELRLQTHHTPSIFNKDMLLGGLLGSLPAGLVLTGIAGIGILAALTAGGAIIGGVIGKKRMERENIEGKPVGQASFWNKDTLIGGLIGFKSAGLVSLVALSGTLAGTLLAASVAPDAAGVVFTGGLALSLLSLGAAPIIGGWIGGKMGEKRMENEYEEAKKQHIVQNISQNVSPEVGEAVGYTMEHKKDWGKQMLEEKLLAAAQQEQQR